MGKQFYHDPDINDQIVTDPEIDSKNIYDGDNKFRRSKNRHNTKATKIFALCALGLAVILALTLLIYIIGSAVIDPDSRSFYFSSDLLSEEGGEFIAYDSINFNVYNYADELRISKEDIEDFEITLECDGKNITKKADISLGVKAMEANVRSGCAVSITLPAKYTGKKVDVKVTSAPIEKTISATFTVKPKWNYEVNDEKGNVCAEIVIYANKKTSVKLSWDPEKLIPDSTNSYIREAGAEENFCYVEVASGTSVTIPMFKVNPAKDYSDNKKVIIIEEGSNE